jgi:hypothetical protein
MTTKELLEIALIQLKDNLNELIKNSQQYNSTVELINLIESDQ